MSAGPRLVAVGRVGRPHGRDGAFYAEGAQHALGVGTEVTVAGVRREVERRAGTADRPIIRLSGIDGREAAAGLRGEALLLEESEAALGAGEWLVADLVGCRIEGLGEVRAVLPAPSCDVLEVGDGPTLVPLVSDAVHAVDLERRVIEIDRAFLGLEAGGPAASAGDDGPALRDRAGPDAP